MTLPEQPRLRRIESFPISQADGEVVFALRDPEGFSGSIVVPYPAAVLASFMDGTRTLAEIQEAFRKQFHQPVALADLEQLVRDLDDRLFLDTERFRARWKSEIEHFLNSKSRAAAHAGEGYPSDPDALRQQLAALFTGDPALSSGKAAAVQNFVGVFSPHIDLRRGGPAYAAAYQRIADQSDADLFIILGTAASAMRFPFSVTRKDFETPLGTVETDRKFCAKLAANLAATPGGKDWNQAADELAHRQEHSIEFQTVFLQYVLGGKRPFKIVPVLVASFHELIADGKTPGDWPAFTDFIAALRKTAAAYEGKVCYLCAGDLAHIGQRFGDREFLNAERLRTLAASDRKWLDAACSADARGLFELASRDQNRDRLGGLPPLYTFLETAQPTRGELLKYDQAIELDGTACVSFAALAFYGSLAQERDSPCPASAYSKY